VTGRDETLAFTTRVLIAALAVAVLLVMWRVAEVFLIAFGGILLAIMLHSIAVPLSSHLRISNQVALVLATLILLVATFCFLIVFGTQAAAQFSLLISEIPEGLEQARAWLRTSQIGRSALELWDSTQRQAASTLLTALPFAGGVLGALGNFALIIVVGIYLAADPDTYADGAVRLLPVEKRKRARFVLDEAGVSLRKWLFGMTLDALFLGTITGFGLWTVGVPLSFALGVLSGMSVFVPYIGPILATVPGLLIALAVSPMHALYAFIVYVIAQQIEGNVAMPLLQRWSVSLPPVLGLLSIFAFGLLFGIWGVLLATPLTVATMTIVRLAYVEGVLERKRS
jgi:predicted PurR-regulated permease PerM